VACILHVATSQNIRIGQKAENEHGVVCLKGLMVRLISLCVFGGEREGLE
jgi:hypothetical protein